MSSDEKCERPAGTREELSRMYPDSAKGAAEKALDDIAALCGRPDWDYPGQIVRDVACLKAKLDRFRDTLRVYVERSNSRAYFWIIGGGYGGELAAKVLEGEEP